MKDLKLSRYFVLVGIVLSAIMLMTGRAMPAATPTDTLTIALGNLAEETFLPWNGTMPRSSYFSPMYDFLVYPEAGTGKILPGLATKWEMSADGKTWTFWLREGVQFHKGWGELTGEDVVYTVKRSIGPESRGPASHLRAWLDKVEAPERYKVVFYLKTPMADLPATDLVNFMQLGIVCKKYVETVSDNKANAEPVATGPYAFVEHKRGLFIKFQAIAKHWRLAPQFKNITFLLIPEVSTRVAMLKAGEVDLAPISYDSLESVKASGVKIISIPKTWAPTIQLGGLVTTDPKRYNPSNPWSDKRVRQALNYAVDKEAIVRTILHGQATPAGAINNLPEWLEVKPYPYDPVKAKQLLVEAGYSKGFPITLKTFVITPGAELPTIGEAVAMYWKQIGLDVKIVPTDWNTVVGEWTGGKAWDFAWVHRGAIFLSPVSGATPDHTERIAFASFVTPKTEEMVSAISSELNLKKRSALVREMGEYLRDEASAVFLAFADEPYGASRKVGKWQTAGFPVDMEYITRAE
jgi:peptide/nickel transport system substrate-binding protein